MIENIEVYNWKRFIPLFSIKDNSIIINSASDLIIIDKESTPKFKLWLIRLIL